MKKLAVVLGVLLAVAVTAIIVESLVQAVYPGSLKWAAPVLCPDDQPDAYVVRETVQDADGTSISYSLFCMGERGDFTEAGSWRPYGLLFLYIYAALLGLLLVVVGCGVVRARRRLARQ